jgi:long-subunit fatty acid transport protein
MDTSSKMSCPHGFKVGAAVDVIPDKLLLALDLKYLLYGESSKEMVTKTTTPAGEVTTTTQRLDWKDAISGYFGAEYMVTSKFPIRVGYEFTTTATPTSRPNPLMMPPGIVHGPTAGAGLHLSHLAFDLGVSYSWGSKDVAASDLAVDAGVAPGKYSTTLLIIAASATYQM